MIFGLTPDIIILLTIIAGFSQAIVLAFTLFVFYKNLLVLKKHNDLTINRFTFQSQVEKYALTLDFADWIKEELSDYIAYVSGDVKHANLTQDEIQKHLVNITEKILKLIKEDFVFKELMFDELKKLYIVLESNKVDTPVLNELELILKKS